MKKILGIFGLLVFVCIVTTLVNPLFVSQGNVENTLRWTALFSVIGIGVSFVIITGGIDLSIGSVMGLTGVLLPLLLAWDYRATNERLTVREVVEGANQVIFDRPLDLRKGDRLIFRGPGQPSGALTVDRAEPHDGGTLATVRESPEFLDSGAVARVTYFEYNSIALSLAIIALVSAAVGLTNGLLITKLRLQPFVVTLCGLLFYRGFARYLGGDRTPGFGVEFHDLRYLALGKPISVPVPLIGWISEGNWSVYRWNWQTQERVLDAHDRPVPLPFLEWVDVPMPLIIMLVIAVAAAVFLNLTVYGRYLLALGRNETAARYSGINTDRMVILAYVFCSLMAGLAGVLFALDFNSVQPSSHGNFYELYAIAAAVLGGCSLRGGQGSILGVIIGTAVLVVLRNAIVLMKIPTDIEFAIIGLVIMAGVIVDELVKRFAARRRARVAAAA